MADGTNGTCISDEDPFLSELKHLGFALWATCEAANCGGAARIDPGPWLDQRLGGRRLSQLETRLRCNCGARRAHLGIAAPPPGVPRVNIYPFS
jgi:hypothetical protein